MKDHEIAKLHNDLRDTATKYGRSQQLRARLAAVVAPLITEIKKRQKWTIRPVKDLAGNICGYRLELPDIPGIIRIESYNVEHDSMDQMDVTITKGRVRRFQINGEIQVPEDVILELIDESD